MSPESVVSTASEIPASVTPAAETSVYGGTPAGSGESAPRRRVTRVHHLAQMKAEGEKWSMLTAYDYSTARIFDEAEIPVLLVGDSAANVVLGYDTTIPVSSDELIPLARAVVRGAPHALVVADLPFGSYEAGPQQALATAVRFFKEAGAHAVKLEGGERVADQIATLTGAGIPVMAHIGFTPQSVNGLGGFRVQGRGDAADQLIADAIAVQEAGAFAVVMEMVPADLAGQITRKLTIPTVGIGAGHETDAQVLVWQDMAGFTHGKTARFVKRFADVGGELRGAAAQYADEVRRGVFPGPEHSY
ncbi:3-methyl-2-oxobutanoate hydroxymethyltransferase [uncultured Gordonia sp.]|uniref:3-methyl-2-oxobutanoate hydroxymethyltransferase n=1 Tax=uncultured Gordonia sp. TaxID=198437 RepID=UPI002583E618|nr:3-methyl-2-oxobutanoate hydroxymethyltransferase [uncultured Gordonia sp.]